jgi:hypothetical protein
MEKLPTIDIKGKEYVMVKDRIIAFNEMYPKGAIATDIISNTDKSVVVKAYVRPEPDRIFTGHSEAFRGQGMMGNVPVEVAETSAVGRALAMLGIGIIEGVASADEVMKAEPQTKSEHTVVFNYQGPEVKCLCGDPAKRVMSKSAANPNRWFYACAKPKAKQCKFFQWEEMGDEDTNYEGDRKLDYNQDTGELL